MKGPRRIIGIIVLAVACSALVTSLRMHIPATTDALGPRVYPAALAGLLLVLSLAYVLGAESSQGEGSAVASAAWLRRFLPLLLFLVGYIVLWPILGFGLVTVLFLAATFRLLGEGRWGVVILVALGATLILYVLFGRLLGVPLDIVPAYFAK